MIMNEHLLNNNNNKTFLHLQNLHKKLYFFK